MLEAPSAKASLHEWLQWLERAHPVAIDPGLERIGRVAERAALLEVPMPIVTVAGTNGKGSTVAMLARTWQLAGYRTGRYTSPHIERFNERIAVDGTEVDDRSLVDAFVALLPFLGEDSLSYFEFTTLAAMRIFIDQCCEVVVLEVGLGGRLDAANLWDADCAIVTGIALDHADWLGTDIEQIGREKAAIGRRDRPLIVSDPDAPASIDALAAEEGMRLQRVGPLDQSWDIAMPGHYQRRNAAAAVAAVKAMQAKLPVAESTLREALASTRLPGRMERRQVEGVDVLLDVAHNPDAAKALATALADLPGQQRMSVIFGAMADKDHEGVVGALSDQVSHWHCIDLPLPRAIAGAALAARINHLAQAAVATAHDDVEQAWIAARDEARETGGCVLVLGSFFTLAAVQEVWRSRHT